MKTYTVYTYAYRNQSKDGWGVLAYTRYDRESEDRKVYQIEAENGNEAKRIAIKLRKIELRNEQAEGK